MPKSWEEEDQIIDLSNINPNKMFAMSYNFEHLKYVITSLIRNQQNFDTQLSDLKYSFLKQKDYSTELELSIMDLKMQREDTPEVLEELLKQKKEIKNKKEECLKELELFEREKQEGKITNKISIYNMKESKKEEKFQEAPQETVITELNTSQKDIISKKEEEEAEKENNKDYSENKNDEDKNEKEGEEKKEENNGKKEKEEKEEKEIVKEEKIEEIKEEKKEEKIEEDKKEEKIEIPPPIPVTTIPKSAESEKNKNKNEDFHKELQLIVGELKNIKSKQQALDKDFSLFKLNITEQIKEKLGNEIPSMINSTFDTKIISIQKNNKKEFGKINEDITNLNNVYEQKLSDLNNNILKEISLKEEKNKEEFEAIKNENLSLKENLSLSNEKLLNMVTTLSFNNLKKEINEKFENERKEINLELSILKSNINCVKNQVFDHLSDSRDHDNIVSLMKIMDSISGNIQKLMDFKKAYEEKDKRKAIVDNNKYVRQEGFNEAISNIHKHMDNNRKEFSEIRLDIDSIRSKDLNIKANLRDLKNLEDSIFIKMKTLKETIRDNFVEKNMLVKNLKYLELQTKQLIEENKKNEKQESWLLAKKPYNGHLCASCEAYIGDLKPNTNSKFIAWNKYPPSNSIDKIFRINAGFSKVLQMVNQDKNDRSKSNSLNNSKEDRNCSSAEGDKRKMEKIPNYKSKSRDKNMRQNNSSTQIEDSEFVGTLPKISMKKNNKSSSDNIFSEERNKTNSGGNIYYNGGKTSANVRSRKSRKFEDEIDPEIKNHKKIEEINDGENKEPEKPKITKVFRKIGENRDKKIDKDKE